MWQPSVQSVIYMFTAYKVSVPGAFFCFVDWSRLAFFLYELAAEHTYKVGAYLADRIDKWKLNPKNVTLIGHSMGAQIAAEAGRILKNKGKPVARVFGKK